MSSDYTFDLHISNLYRGWSNLAGWILRTFTMRDPHLMLTLKSLVLSRLDYASQLWSPYLLKHIYLIEKVQRAFTKHISGIRDFSYCKCLETLKLYSLQRRRDRYSIIYVWNFFEALVPNLSDPITCSLSDRRGRTCIVYHAGVGRLGTLKYNSFRWRSIRMFNRLPKCIRMLSSCSVIRFKSLPARIQQQSGRWSLLTWRSLRGWPSGQIDVAIQTEVSKYRCTSSVNIIRTSF